MRSWWIAVLLAACGSSVKGAERPAAPVATCTTAAENTVGTLVAVLDPKPPAGDIQKFVDLIRERCEQDAWSAEAQRCMSEIKQQADADRCEPMLTDAQKAALIRDQAEKFGLGPPEPKSYAAPDPAEEGGSGAPKAAKPLRNADPCDGGE